MADGPDDTLSLDKVTGHFGLFAKIGRVVELEVGGDGIVACYTAIAPIRMSYFVELLGFVDIRSHRLFQQNV